MNAELKRLEKLLPNDLLPLVAIAIQQRTSASSTDSRLTLIRTKRLDRKSYRIEIDGNSWQEIDLDYRNLLFWHEVARIQQHSIASYPWELIVFAAGLGMSMIEVTSQQVLLLLDFGQKQIRQFA
ncbi:DUF3318 domain-containing protein [Merismopedia glauca]|uniref:Uncharacterized protein n=1 Tax=Merismopedia glauca CCAP 1448/3 TaxID=1296344 RepID=A0A2T1BX97_9CYAN|nr:DUF3318 domain-containing protein [Merismopedia glauca]PSB00578.1 hypothetical protein C7B64_22755 [Merismopedia glauca CCAP 1448/3]